VLFQNLLWQAKALAGIQENQMGARKRILVKETREKVAAPWAKARSNGAAIRDISYGLHI
jgi:hypothetical protein